MEIFLTKYALEGSIVPVDATINAKTGIATETDSGIKHLRGSYELTLESATAEVRVRIRNAIRDAEAKVEYLSHLPLTLNWCEQGKPKFKIIQE